MARVVNLLIVKSFWNISGINLKKHLMTSSIRAEKVLEDLKKNSYFDKYAEKIAKLQRTSLAEFLANVDKLEKKTAPKAKPTEQVTEGKFSQLLNPKKPLTVEDVLLSKDTPLHKIMKIELIENKSTEEIKDIWHNYHVQTNFISAVIDEADFRKIEEHSKQFPTFLFPLPRSQGYEFIMCQFDKNVVHFTPLLYYQVHKENAPECLTITHYTELREDKGIVLMRGEYDKNVIDLKEAQCLANELQLYYVKPTDEKLQLLDTFTQKPEEFKHMDLIKQIENLSL